MDERRTLSLLAWTIGGVVGIMFLLNGLALSVLPQPDLAQMQAAPPAQPVINATANLRVAMRARPAAGGAD